MTTGWELCAYASGGKCWSSKNFNVLTKTNRPQQSDPSLLPPKRPLICILCMAPLLHTSPNPSPLLTQGVPNEWGTQLLDTVGVSFWQWPTCRDPTIVVSTFAPCPQTSPWAGGRCSYLLLGSGTCRAGQGDTLFSWWLTWFWGPTLQGENGSLSLNNRERIDYTMTSYLNV